MTDPARAVEWWRLERQRDDSFDNRMMPVIRFDAGSEESQEFHEDPVLHFCTAHCLATWAKAANHLIA